MGKFEYMPEEVWPDETEHIEYSEVYRAIKNSDTLEITDFLPWIIEHSDQKRLFRKTFQQPEYGMSVFTDLNSLKNTVMKIPALNRTTNGYAKGFTTIERGISTKENAKHHVDYFLYDYLNNSPKDDFIIWEVRAEHE
ncbi:MAG: hypothetical protein ACI4NM_06900 [Bullifex sp.]